MTLDDFIEMKKEELEKFKTFWIRQRKIKPALYPLELLAGDWEEHLNIDAK